MLNNSVKQCGIFCGIALLIPLILTGCLSDGEIPRPSRVQVALELDNVVSSDPITAGDDAMNISRIRLLHGSSFFRLGEDSLYLLQTSQSRAVEQFDSGSENPTPLATGNLFKGEYQLLNIQFPRADSTNSGVVDSVFSEGGRFSIVVEGEYNGESFTYKAARSFETIQNFEPPLDVPEFDESYVFLIYSNVADWFAVTDSTSLLDPSDETNSDMINANIADSFTISLLQDGSGN